MSRRGATATFVAALALLALTQWLGYVRADRVVIASTPTVKPRSTLAEFRLGGGQRACITAVEFSPQAQAAAVQVTRTRGGGPALELTAQAPGYRARGAVQGGYGEQTLVEIAFAAAPRTLEGGTLCLRNAGREAVAFLGNMEGRSVARQTVTLDGVASPTQLSVTLQERAPHPLAARAGVLLAHLSAFRPSVVGPVTLWALVFAIGLGVPVLVGRALARAVREDRPA